MSKSSALVLSTMRWAKEQGFKPIPLVPGSKAAAVKEYQKAGYEPEPDEFWEEREYGVGVILGPTYGGPIDFDLDCKEAVALAPYILPATKAVFGRPGKPKSHYVYKVKTEKFDTKVFRDDLIKQNILEVRGDGGNQTVFPGSIHEGTGELIDWAFGPNPEIAEVDPTELVSRARLLAIGCYIIRNIWTDGFRNDPTMPLAGILAKSGFLREDVIMLFDAMAEVEGKHDKSRLKTINITFNRWEADQPVSGAPKLRELMGKGHGKVVDGLMTLMGSKSIAKIEEYNQKYVCVMMGGQRVFRLPTKPTGAPELLDKQGFLDWHSEDVFIDPEGKVKKWAAAWLNSPQRTKYTEIDFLPGVHEEHPEYAKHEGTYNLWNGWAYPVRQKGDKPEGSCDAFLEVLRDVLCNNEEEYLWVLNFFASIILDPLELSRTALVIKGPQGTGKSTAVGYFGKILGDYYYVASNEEHVVGKFNNHMARCLLLHSEEALYAGNPKHKNTLKSMITDEHRTWESKNVNAKQIKNYLRLVLTSNEHRPAPLEIGDRRYTVIDGGNRKLPEALRVRLIHELNNGGPEALMYYLMHEFDYKPEMAQKNLRTAANLDLVLTGLDPVNRWFLEKLQDGVLLGPGFEWCKKGDNPWPKTVSSVALYFDFLTWYKSGSTDRQTDRDYNETMFGMQLQRILDKRKLLKKQVWYKTAKPDQDDELTKQFPKLVWKLSERQRSYSNFPTLDESRQMFQSMIGEERGMVIDWVDPDPDDPDTPAYAKANKQPVPHAEAKKKAADQEKF